MAAHDEAEAQAADVDRVQFLAALDKETGEALAAGDLELHQDDDGSWAVRKVEQS